ncbi:MAG: transketolase [Ottowia sp.]|nr:transketolase [Ottowia sp.]
MNSNATAQSTDQLCINTLRFLAVDAIQNAGSGHPGLPLGAAPMAYVLWQHFLRHDPAHPHWPDRDRFVLSAGHGSALLYSLLYLSGYALDIADLKQFRQWGSKTPGHPERGHVPGVEVTTGPLGQGFANAVGLAMAERHLAARYNHRPHAPVNHRTWVLASDGDLMEGISYEAASLAGHLGLGKLTCLYDDNRVTLAAGTPIAFTEDRVARFAAQGWHTQVVDDGNDLAALQDALRAATQNDQQPSFIAVRTHLGYGSPQQDTYHAHGSPLGEDSVAATKEKLGWHWSEPFHVPAQAREHMRQALQKGGELRRDWQQRMQAYQAAEPERAAELEAALSGQLPAGWDADLPVFAADTKGLATRKAGGQVINTIAQHLPVLSGGSADLDPSTYTALDDLGDFGASLNPATDTQGSDGGGWSYRGRNIHFGVREHAMGAIANGLAAHGGVRPFTATFLVFSDYMRPPIRLAALSQLPVVFVFTHDSIALGEDGPTHQPIEQLASLRAMPGLTVIRPADANETTVAWCVAMENQQGPTALILSRQALPIMDRQTHAAAAGLRRGAYVLREAKGGVPALILLASGSEVALALQAADALEQQGQPTRVVSMPSWALFDSQPGAYRDEVLPPAVRARLAIEAGASMGWHRYVGDGGAVLGIDRYGASAPGEVVLAHLGFTVDNVVAQARSVLAA